MFAFNNGYLWHSVFILTSNTTMTRNIHEQWKTQNNGNTEFPTNLQEKKSQTPKRYCSGKEVSIHTLDLDFSLKRKISFLLYVLSHIHKTRKCCFSAEVLSVSVNPCASSVVPRFYTTSSVGWSPATVKGIRKKPTIITYHLLLIRLSP